MTHGDIRRFQNIAIAALGLCIMIVVGANPAIAEPVATEAAATVGKPLALSQYIKPQLRLAKKTAKKTGTNIGEKAASKTARSRPAKLAPKSPTARPGQLAAESGPDTQGVIPNDLPDSVANASAALTSGGPGRAPSVMAAAAAITDDATPAPIEIVSGVQIASADQFNDLDRALLESVAITSAPATKSAPAATGIGDVRSFWSTIDDTESGQRASLIGKVLIAFGALLTFGSILRMMSARRLRA